MPVTTDPARFSVPDARDLRAMRLVARLTIREAAAEVGVREKTLRRWEQGVNSPRLCDVQALLALYERKLDGQQQLQA